MIHNVSSLDDVFNFFISKVLSCICRHGLELFDSKSSISLDIEFLEHLPALNQVSISFSMGYVLVLVALVEAKSSKESIEVKFVNINFVEFAHDTGHLVLHPQSLDGGQHFLSGNGPTQIRVENIEDPLEFFNSLEFEIFCDILLGVERLFLLNRGNATDMKDTNKVVNKLSAINFHINPNNN